jgi:hypothetical protein
MCATSSYVLQPLGQVTIDHALRRKDDPAIFKRSLQQVPDIEGHPPADAMWNDNLILSFYRYKFHRIALKKYPVRQFNIPTVIEAIILRAYKPSLSNNYEQIS